MHSRFARSVVLTAMLSVAATAVAAQMPAAAAQPDPFDDWVSSHVVVRFSSAVIERAAAISGSKRSIAQNGLVASFSPPLRDTYERWSAVGVSRLYPHDFSDRELATRLGLDRVFLIEVPAGTDVPSMAADLRAHAPQVEIAAVDVVGTHAQFIPDDDYFGLQYGMHNDGRVGWTIDADIDAPEAWEIHTGAAGTVTLAIIDSGIDPHVEFAGRMITGRNVTPVGDANVTTDGTGHGTHVTGIAAATGNNGIGVAGVTWGASIMPVRVLSSTGFGTAAVTCQGLIWAADNGAHVCNMSLEFYNLDCDMAELFQSCVNYAHEIGAVIVASVGNAHGREIAYPARLDNCLAVGSTDQNDLLSSFSNFGPELDVTAPGTEIISTDRGTSPTGNYVERSGTSMASPHVAGLAALIKSFAPGLSNDSIAEIIIATADDLGSEGWDEQFGHGRINARSALGVAGTADWMVSSDPPDGAIDAAQPVGPGGSAPAGWKVIELTFVGDVPNLTAGDFDVTSEGLPLDVFSAVPDGSAVTLELAGPIPNGSWTTITHRASGRSVRLGALPGDVDGDGTTSVLDLLRLIDAYKASRDPTLTCLKPLPPYSTDIDRSGALDMNDIIVLIDLLNGAPPFDVYLSASLAE